MACRFAVYSDKELIAEFKANDHAISSKLRVLSATVVAMSEWKTMTLA